jgi:hypothetical protein
MCGTLPMVMILNVLLQKRQQLPHTPIHTKFTRSASQEAKERRIATHLNNNMER